MLSGRKYDMKVEFHMFETLDTEGYVLQAIGSSYCHRCGRGLADLRAFPELVGYMTSSFDVN